jgi:hypothetical protein
MTGQIEARVFCPYCGEPLDVLVDPSFDQQSYTEDCQVCCQPMVVRVSLDSESMAAIEALREDDA